MQACSRAEKVNAVYLRSTIESVRKMREHQWVFATSLVPLQYFKGVHGVASSVGELLSMPHSFSGGLTLHGLSGRFSKKSRPRWVFKVNLNSLELA